MNIEHHPCDETLVGYTAGTLQPALALVVGVHLEMCARCGEVGLLGTELGGVLLDTQNSEQLPDESFARCWSTIESLPDRVAAGNKSTPPSSPAGILEKCLPGNLEELPWRRVTSNIAQFLVPGFQDHHTWARLFKFQPGTLVPHHGHQHEEFSLVLQGSYTEHSGRFGIGDFSEADAAYDHAPVVDSDEPCIALIGATGRIHFDRLVYRALSRLIRI